MRQALAVGILNAARTAVLAGFGALVLLAGETAGSQKAAASETVSGPHSSVQDTLNKRCVVCHGCYDAPCQLKLSSPAGWQRGATTAKVYDSKRLEDAPTTRLGIDATTVPAWRQKGFFPVTADPGSTSVLEHLLKAGRRQSFKLGAALPDEICHSGVEAGLEGAFSEETDDWGLTGVTASRFSTADLDPTLAHADDGAGEYAVGPGYHLLEIHLRSDSCQQGLRAQEQCARQGGD